MDKIVVPYISTRYNTYDESPCDFILLENWRITGRWQYVGRNDGTERIDVEIISKKEVKVIPEFWWQWFTLKPFETATLTTSKWVPENEINFYYNEYQEVMGCSNADTYKE